MTWRPLSEDEVRTAMERLDRIALLRPLHEVCKAYNVTIEDVLRKRRFRRIVYARDACCHRMYAIGLSLHEIGKILTMDHTSVISAIRRYKSRDNGRALT